MIMSLFAKAEADKLHANLTAELQYVPRSRLTFKIFGYVFPLPRGEASHRKNINGSERKNQVDF